MIYVYVYSECLLGRFGRRVLGHHGILVSEAVWVTSDFSGAFGVFSFGMDIENRNIRN